MYTFNLKDSARGFFRGLFPIRGPGAGPPGMVQVWQVLRRVVPSSGCRCAGENQTERRPARNAAARDGSGNGSRRSKTGRRTRGKLECG